jgi:hypothetical protein
MENKSCVMHTFSQLQAAVQPQLFQLVALTNTHEIMMWQLLQYNIISYIQEAVSIAFIRWISEITQGSSSIQ